MAEGDQGPDLIGQRRAKLERLRARGEAYPNDFRRDALAADLHRDHGHLDAAALEAKGVRTRIAGRMMTRRVMGKAAFAHLQDMSGQIQIYARRDRLPEGAYEAFEDFDIGDILGVEGGLFRTRKGELTVQADRIRLLAKALRPLPEKFHGLTDPEARHRQRYLDLVMNETTRRTFAIRSRVIEALRRFLAARGFVEVETPMMQPLPGGAAARPFVTHHNALDLDLYLRIAPELYLKRLVVGGVERVFEVNRSFRNEGLSTQHNPEFTMLEFYQAYADYRDLMSLTEEMLRETVAEVLGQPRLDYQGGHYDLAGAFRRVSLREVVREFNPGIDPSADREALARHARALAVEVKPEFGAGKLLVEIFEKTAEDRLQQPTFVTGYPAEVSPLARRSPADPFVTERFELFIAGREIANGFSELNDPDDQAQRFREQAAARAAGDPEAMAYDADYVTALEYGLPPTAGEGVGIDRLVMLCTDSPSIRDVVLFPHLRPKQRE
jgi:lysyl-tRNA synthetase class 2